MNSKSKKGRHEMNYSQSFNEQEITTLLLAPVEAGIAVLLSSHDNLIGTAQEVFALYNATNKKVAQQYPNNGLIQELLMGNHKEADQKVIQQADTYIKDASARDNAKADALATCQKAATLLTRANPQDAQGYKQWLVDVTTHVAS